MAAHDFNAIALLQGHLLMRTQKRMQSRVVVWSVKIRLVQALQRNSLILPADLRMTADAVMHIDQ
ncbi:MAG: hypothetical protein CO188_05420 [Zetaproteobacteria bacterium CG_4_9_14_3_um_filter_54_145]|nr:MAG: hypothetical protein COZ50_08740 [Zetaproteobacteria bacterium CG_4_10_14_3_um_filter_54_28]PJA29922.1 MAG: hypothetical protein CO188_05420 [Zetaproteobacteria bacterium CG_4_9_14_3_um_filter_54_145]